VLKVLCHEQGEVASTSLKLYCVLQPGSSETEADPFSVKTSLREDDAV